MPRKGEKRPDHYEGNPNDPQGMAVLAKAYLEALAVKGSSEHTVQLRRTHLNRFIRWASSYEGVMPFRPNESEHPHINYRSMPLHGLFELQQLIGETQERLEEVHCPVTIYQGTDDKVVDPKGADIMMKKLGTEQKELVMIPSDRHGILNEDIGGVQGQVVTFLQTLE